MAAAPVFAAPQDAVELKVEVRREPAGHAGGRVENRLFLPELRVRVPGRCHFDLLDVAQASPGSGLPIGVPTARTPSAKGLNLIPVRPRPLARRLAGPNYPEAGRGADRVLQQRCLARARRSAYHSTPLRPPRAASSSWRSAARSAP